MLGDWLTFQDAEVFLRGVLLNECIKDLDGYSEYFRLLFHLEAEQVPCSVCFILVLKDRIYSVPRFLKLLFLFLQILGNCAENIRKSLLLWLGLFKPILDPLAFYERSLL